MKKELNPLTIVGVIAAACLLVYFAYSRYSAPTIRPIIHAMPKPGDPAWFNADGTPRDTPPPGAGRQAVPTTPASTASAQASGK